VENEVEHEIGRLGKRQWLQNKVPPRETIIQQAKNYAANVQGRRHMNPEKMV
jgi:hypothetical protein